ncbi:hypothetical protein DRN70_00250 [Methanosarcinales archaeon]|nr:MAG: hypothetical protein DRN70_00250 [Methanosarcinales archaeon]
MKIYLDIETTGLSRTHNSVTVVGIFDGKRVIQLVSGIDLCEESLSSLLGDVERVVTFNGKRFDIPFLKHHFPNAPLSHLEHFDLMYLGWKLGWRGGQKAIEKRLGLSRNSGIRNGREAVRLWHAYKLGDQSALERLLEYNSEDLINMHLIEAAITREFKN